MRNPIPARPTADRIDQAIDVAITIGLAVLILVGFATSYRTLRDLAATTGGYPHWLAPAVPLSFDLGIVVLSLKVTRAAREGRTAPVMRLLVAALSACTVIANAAAATHPTARLLHAVPPAMFIVCFESVVITARRKALAEMRLLPDPLPRLRASRWFLAPRNTWNLWRCLVLESAGLHPLSTQQLPTLGQRVWTPTAEAVGPSPTPSSTQRGVIAPALLRDQAAAEIIRSEPKLSAAELAARLAARGHPVSVRTAQRVRARAAAGPELLVSKTHLHS